MRRRRLNLETTRSPIKTLAIAFQTPEDCTVSEFAEKYRYLSPEDTDIPGKWTTWQFQREMQDTFMGKDGDMCVFMTSSQIGKTACMMNGILYVICTQTGGITFMLPSETLAKDYSTARFAPMLRDCPELAKKIPSNKRAGNKVLFKQYAGGFLRFVGSGNADKLCSFPSPWLVIDELDRCQTIARNSDGKSEGNSLKLLFERMKRFSKKFVLMTSTPGVKDTSQIYEYFKDSDQSHPHIACPHCEHEQFLAWDQFTWKSKEDKHSTLGQFEKISSFEFVCSSCEQGFTDLDLPEFPPHVKWVKRNPNAEYRGFHINAFYTNSWRENFKKYLEAGQNQAKLMVWWNTTLGLPYSFEALATPDWQVLQDKEKHYKRGTVPAPACLLLAGCDVQKDRIEVTVAGIYKKQTFVIDHHVIPGNTFNADDPMWQDLDDLVYKATWDHELGHKLQIHKMAIDSRHNPNAVGRFARTRKKVIPVTGTGVWSDVVLPAKKFEIKANGKSMRLGKSRYPLGVNLIKMDLYGRLNLDVKETLPSEYIGFPEGLSDEYYKQVTGEACEMVEGTDGKTRYKWVEKYPHLEGLDCLVYILGLHHILNMHKWSDERWADLEYSLEPYRPNQSSSFNFL